MKIFFPGGKKVTANYKGFQVTTDQSIASGGDGQDPNPYDLFKASIGTCMGYYVMAFCIQREIPLDSVYMDIEFEEDGLIEKVKTTIRVDNRFPKKYFDSVVRVTEACKIKKQMKSPPCYEIKISNMEQLNIDKS